eukprot:TRINITY_DN2764_c0_g1_i1.p1 TRINITY_DN2764_c0_g1~~TRINITY_DN2764_c0_g1_i1.p1  ORF type:complete len:229 (-),score=60.97 TRINITY_DN2764_c0_g1_i1:73-759(-)
MADREWIQRYENVKRLIDEIRTEIADRPAGDVQKRSLDIRKKLTIVEREIGTLQSTQKAAGEDLPPKEQQRRKNLLQKLQQDKALVLQKFRESSGPNSADRAALLGDKKRGVAAQETQETKDRDNDEVVLRQRQILEDQDKDLDSLHETVLRTKQIGKMIGNELDEHSRLLDTLDDEVEDVTTLLQHERRRLDKLVEKTKSKTGFCIICFLIIGITVLILIVLNIIRF